MQNKKDICVIGAGVVGLTAAWHLAREGYNVTVFTKGEVGSGATLASLGVLMPHAPWMRYGGVSTQLESLWMYPEAAKELFDETGIDVQYERLGRLQLFTSEHQSTQYQEYLKKPNKDWGPKDLEEPQLYLSEEEVKTQYPELSEAPFGALKCLATAHVDVPSLVSALRSACLKYNVDLREDCPVHHVRYKEEGDKKVVDCLQTAHGVFSADHYILAAGAWSQTLLPEEMQEDLWVEPLKGQALLLQGNRPLTDILLRARGVYVLPMKNNQFMIGATKELGKGFDDTLTEEAETMLLNKAEALVPALAETKLMRHWCGFRPKAGKEGVQLKHAENIDNMTFAFGHNSVGICMMPYVGKRIVELFQ